MTKDQLKSEGYLKGFKWSDAVHGERKFGSIYFAYNDHDLTPDDKDAVDLLVAYVGRTVQESQNVDIKFLGYTDMRGTQTYNFGLSQRRIDSVKKYFSDQLKKFKIKEDTIVNYLPFVAPFEVPYGEKFARIERKYWDEDRRVDVMVRLYPKSKSKEHLEWRECIKQNVWFFTGYCDKAYLWREYGVEYLLPRSFFVYDSMGTIQIKELDLEKVLKMLEKLMTHQEYGHFKIILASFSSSAEKKEYIEERYFNVFKGLWEQLYFRYKEIWKKQKTPFKCGGNGRVTSITEYTTKSDSRLW